MTRKILDVTIKTQDHKGHVAILHAADIELDSIVFKADKKDKKDEKKTNKK